jgi:hypothetical protein
MRVRAVSVIVLLLVVVVGCTSASEETSTTATTPTTNPDPFGCESAPEAERHSYSEFPFAIDENPVDAGAETILRVGTPAAIDLSTNSVPDDLGMTDLGAKWQCWTGTDWVETHVLMLDEETIAAFPGETTTSLGVGRSLPDSFRVVIPDVSPGWYRIEVRTIGPEPFDTDGSERFGYIAVEVSG